MLYARPSIGWLSYYALRQSPRRLWVVLLLGGALTLVCVWESQHTLTLTFQTPGPYPPAVIVVGSPDSASLTAWDACGIEAARKPVKVPQIDRTEPVVRKQKMANNDEIAKLLTRLPNPMKILHLNHTAKGGVHPKQLEDLHDLLDHHDKFAEVIYNKMVNSQDDPIPEEMVDHQDNSVINMPVDSTSSDSESQEELEPKKGGEVMKMEWGEPRGRPREVWVYLWQSTVFKGDKWAHFVGRLPSVHLNYFDPKKATPSTHLKTWMYRAGLGTQPTWVRWVTAALSLLWSSGGLVLPTGVILTQPLALSTMGEGEGILLEAEEEGDVSPLVLGTPPQHPIVASAMGKLEAGSARDTEKFSPFATSELAYLAPTTSLLTEALKEACVTEGLPDLGLCEDFMLLSHEKAVAVDPLQAGPSSSPRTLFHPTGFPEDFKDPVALTRLFERLRLEEYCPRVAKEVLGGTSRDL